MKCDNSTLFLHHYFSQWNNLQSVLVVKYSRDLKERTTKQQRVRATQRKGHVFVLAEICLYTSLKPPQYLCVRREVFCAIAQILQLAGYIWPIKLQEDGFWYKDPFSSYLKLICAWRGVVKVCVSQMFVLNRFAKTYVAYLAV